MNVTYEYLDDKFKLIRQNTHICFSRVPYEHEGRYISFILPPLSTYEEKAKTQLYLYKDMIKEFKEFLVKPKTTFTPYVRVTIDMKLHNYTTVLAVFTCFRDMYEPPNLLAYYAVLRKKRRLSKIAALILSEQCDTDINCNHTLSCRSFIHKREDVKKIITTDFERVKLDMVMIDPLPVAELNHRDGIIGNVYKVHDTWSCGFISHWYNKTSIKDVVWKTLGL